MSAKVKRYLKRDPNARKKKFLNRKRFNFLKDISFYAIAEHEKGKGRDELIEFKLPAIKKLVSEAKKVGKLRTKVKGLNTKLEEIRLQNNELQEHVKNLKGTNESLKRTAEEHEGAKKLLQDKVEADKYKKMNPRDRSPENSFSLMEKKGAKLHGPAFQGGAPS